MTAIAAAAANAYDAYQAAPKAPNMAQTASKSTAAKVGRQFETQFVSQMFQHMFAGIKTDGLFGGGSGEEMFRSLLIDEYAKMVANRGGSNGNGSGFGIGSAVQKMLLKHQEVQ
ncbi:chemotaxis protein chel [Paramagnetospirillum marisnigri]|uniref:Chemotaxis protein chel n=1 Tax=Paramagnetospirillum marisnigri TaxID=1285242 RepID=A0A178MCV6_9PROT|nr:rod-binding protein [Paramagnetospirillum marisnigri]OAN46640.1 chemotaxis protein chel [Paramagnetospirillum marisnigri]